MVHSVYRIHIDLEVWQCYHNALAKRNVELGELKLKKGSTSSLKKCMVSTIRLFSVTATPTVVQHTNLCEPLAFTVLLHVGREASEYNYVLNVKYRRPWVSSLLIFWRIL